MPDQPLFSLGSLNFQRTIFFKNFQWNKEMAVIFSIEPSNVEDYKFAFSVYLLANLVCDFNIVMLFQDIYCIYIM
jgi:hypothetical protein